MAGDARQEAADNVAALETRQEAAANKAPTPPAQEAPKQELPTLEPAGSRTDTSFFVHRKDEYPKNKLNVETSIVDRLKYHDYDSSFSQMARYYAAMGFSVTYTGSASQNINMLNWMKNHGVNGGGEIEGLIRQSGETGFALVRTGETVITSEATQNLKAMLKMKDRLGMRKTGKYVFPDAQRMRQQTDEQMKWFQTAPAGGAHRHLGDGALVAGDGQHLHHAGVGLVAPHGHLHPAVDNGPLLIDTAAQAGLGAGDDLLGHVQNTGRELILPGQAGHLGENRGLQLLNFCFKSVHMYAPSS